MKWLSYQDVVALSGLVRDLYACHRPDAFTAGAIDSVGKIVSSECTSYFELDAQGNLAYQVEPGGPADFRDSRTIFNRYMAQHPLLAYCQRTQDLGAVKVSDLLSRFEWHRRGLYNEYFRKAGMEHQIGVGFWARPAAVVGLSLSRKRPDFAERDRLLLNLLRPHLAEAYRGVQLVARMHRDLLTLEDAWDAADQGVVLVDHEGRVRLMTPKARRWFAKYFGPVARRLPELLIRWMRQQEAALGQNGGVPPVRTPLSVERGEERLTVRWLSHTDHNRLLLLTEQEALPPVRFEGFGLTRREAEVLAWVTQGKTNAEIGTILGASGRTVEKHLERIFRKLGVENRTAAALYALSASPQV